MSESFKWRISFGYADKKDDDDEEEDMNKEEEVGMNEGRATFLNKWEEELVDDSTCCSSGEEFGWVLTVSISWWFWCSSLADMECNDEVDLEMHWFVDARAIVAPFSSFSSFSFSFSGVVIVEVVEVVEER